MKIYFRIVLIVFIFTLSISNSYAQITINNTGYTPTQLVNGVLVPSSSGTTISNVVFRGVYNNSNRYQVGYFSTATTTLAQLGFTNGVVLSTGNTATIPLALGTNPRASQMATSYSSGTSGELRQTGSPAPIIIQDLDVLAGASNYFNGAILEFDFVPVENSVSFRYIFGSEEYSDNSGTINYQCSNYNDKFGFLISGPGITGGQGFSNNARNIARLANGSEVSINSVNSGVVGASGGAPSAATCLAANSSWVQNSPTPEYLGTIDGTQLNGNTRILTASQTGLIPGQTYHIKLIITDVGDATYDSVVYLEAGSFTTESVCNAGPNQSLCAATSTTLAASSPATGTWSLVSGTGTFVSNTNPNTVVNGLSVGTNVFRWTAADLSCTSDVTVTVTAAPTAPTLACYQTATFNSATCTWNVTGTQPVQPTTACYQTATFNTTTCAWVLTGTQPTQPTATNCWDNYQFNTTTCAWVNNGTQPTQPTATNCWDNYQFNNTTCAWENNGTQPVQPTATNCWDNYQFNNTTCAWVNNGSQPVQPTATNCWDNYQFNTTTCAWVNNGTQPTQPTATNCWDNYQFNTTSCTWVNNGTQPVAPTASAQSFCTSANATVANLVPSGTGIQWYANASGGSALAASTLLTSTTYYVSQITNGCESARTSVVVSLNNNRPLLTVNNAVCNGSTYSIVFNSNGTVTASAGTISGNTISGIAVGTNVVVTATSSTGCIATTTMTVASPTNCTNPPTNCITPTLSAGQGTCTGTGTYNFAFNASAGAVVTASSGTISGNTVTGITVGTNVTLTATSGSCVTSLIVNSPADCSAPCSTPTASFSAGVCNGTTYSINFTNPNNATISATAGNVNTTTISAIPVGTNTTITVQIAGCSTQILTITSPQLGVTPFAGNDGNLTLCGSTTPTNTQLFAALGGTPQTGGTWTNSGNNYTYTVTANSACASIPFDTAIITLTSISINDFEIVGQCNGVNYELTVQPVQTNVVYNWYNSSDVLIGTGTSIAITTLDNYRVEGKVSICSESKLINVDDVNCMIPKGVSPNNDGLNDTWDLSNLNVEKAQIFNRYGMEMYAKQNYVNEWDGKTNQGHELPSATYYYVVTFKNGTAKTGWVYLNREK